MIIALHVMQIERLEVLETIVQERGMITSSSCCSTQISLEHTSLQAQKKLAPGY